MKKSAVIVLLWVAMSAGALHAQWSVTPELGITAEKEEYRDWSSGLKIGAGVEYRFGKLFSLESGIYFARQKRRYTYWDYSSVSDLTGYYPFSMTDKVNRNFLQIPVVAKFSWKVADEVRLNVGAGPYIGLSLGDTWQGGGWNSYYYPDDGSEYEYPSAWPDRHYNTKDPDWGLFTVVGLEVKNWVINLRDDISPGDINSSASGTAYETLSLSVGYKFKLGKK